MNRLLVVLFCAALCFNIKAQSFYEIQWKADIEYTALVTYYDETQIEVRVKYIAADSVYRVAKYLAEGTVDTDDEGKATFFFDGHDAEVIYTSDGRPSRYIADNFLFLNPDDDYVFQDLYTVDDVGIEQDDIEGHIFEAKYRLLNPAEDFNQQFIFNYFEPQEPEYNRYLALVKPAVAPEPEPAPDPATTPTAEPVIHLIMVADVEDRSIGKSTAQDQQDITTTFNKISRELGVDLKDYQFSGSTFNKNDIIDNVRNLQTNPDDVIIYYYSGHGYNDTENTSEYPTMALDGTDMALEEVYNELQSKNARLTLIIGDMCNSLPENRRAVGRREHTPFKSGYLFDEQKLSKLFLQSSGFLISTSSQKGEWSFCMNNSDGSMGNGQFTHAFIESVIKEASKVSASDAEWKALIVRAYNKAHESTMSITNQNGEKGQSGFGSININY